MASSFDRVGLQDRRWVLAMLTLMYVFSVLDRQVLVIFQEPIKNELGLSDTQLGLLTGFAFVAFYTVFGVIIARLADKGVRKVIIACCFGAWSMMTLLAGVAQTYVQLLCVRMGLGVAEGGTIAPAHSIISDIFPREKRASAMSVFSTGQHIGTLLGFLSGGLLLTVMGWRKAFIALGVVGIVAATLVLLIQEPRRPAVRASSSPQANKNVLDTLMMLLRDRRLVHLLAASVLTSCMATTVLVWFPSFMVRSFSLPPLLVGSGLGVILGVGGAVGTILSGLMTDRLVMTRGQEWSALVPGIAVTLSLPLLLGAILTSSWVTALALLIVPKIALSMYVAPLFAFTQDLVSGSQRAAASSLLILILNVIGLGIAPLVTGIVSDLLTASHGQDGLRYSIFVIAAVAGPWSSLHYFLAARSMRRGSTRA